MCPRPPRSTRTDTPFPDPPLFRPQARQRRLAAAALADHRQGLATPHREADPIHRAHHPLLAEPGAAAAEVAADLSRLEDDVGRDGHDAARSEEQTSELQSLMRISYAVFCLKKNITNTEN